MRVDWFEGHDDEAVAGLVRLVQAVAARGGAVGWLTVPEPEQVRDWLDGLLASGARVALAYGGAPDSPETVLACGAWCRYEPVVLGGMAEVKKVMTHPGARSQGAGRAVVQLLIDDAQTAGVELLTLECRGNNHGAQRLYAALGFSVTGRRPDAIRIGDERFDQVLMHRDLRAGPAGLVRHGSRHEGLGAT